MAQFTGTTHRQLYKHVLQQIANIKYVLINIPQFHAFSNACSISLRLINDNYRSAYSSIRRGLIRIPLGIECLCICHTDSYIIMANKCTNIRDPCHLHQMLADFKTNKYSLSIIIDRIIAQYYWFGPFIVCGY